jgi:hypothetical protein
MKSQQGRRQVDILLLIGPAFHGDQGYQYIIVRDKVQLEAHAGFASKGAAREAGNIAFERWVKAQRGDVELAQ